MNIRKLKEEIKSLEIYISKNVFKEFIDYDIKKVAQ